MENDGTNAAKTDPMPSVPMNQADGRMGLPIKTDKPQVIEV